MNAPAPSREEKVLNGLLLAALFIAGVVLVREGPHFDNVVDGWPFFTSAFFAGTLMGYLIWTYSFGVTPALKFSGSYRHPWLAALTLGLVAASTASYINRTFAAPPDRTITGAIESVAEGKGNARRALPALPDQQRGCGGVEKREDGAHRRRAGRAWFRFHGQIRAGHALKPQRRARLNLDPAGLVIYYCAARCADMQPRSA